VNWLKSFFPKRSKKKLIRQNQSPSLLELDERINPSTNFVGDINSIPLNSSPSNFEVIGNTIYFAANDGINGFELWKSDGTNSGTVIVKDIFPGSQGSMEEQPERHLSLLYRLTNVGGTLFFTADDGVNGRELWKSDGTATGTVLIKDINLGIKGSNPRNLTTVNGICFFYADNGSNGLELWKSDGTAAGTVLVKDINPGQTGSETTRVYGVGNDAINVNGTLFFVANTSSNGYELWKSDGTTNGTVLIKDIIAGTTGSDPRNLINLNGACYFYANNGVNGRELWKSDGTAAGTLMVKDIYGGSSNSQNGDWTVVNGALFFAPYEVSIGSELWKSNGTSAGTVLVKEIIAGGVSSYPANLTNVNGTCFFTADNGLDNRELWKSDGTAAGTVLVKEIYPGSTRSMWHFANLTNVNGTCFFTADDGVNGKELWKSDGSASGTILVKDITSGISGTTLGNFTNFGGILFFSANDEKNGLELWKSDGTASGTFMVKNIYPKTDNSNPSNLTNFDSGIFFTANDGKNGTELWKSNGNSAGTILVKDIYPGANGSSPSGLTNVNGTVYFTANDGTNGAELWKSNGNSAGTILVKDIYPGANGSSPSELTNVNGNIYFTANDGTNGAELWKSDGTSAGTILVKDIYPGANGSSISGLINVNGNIYFTANDGINGAELWKSDGTSAGTVLVKDIYPGATGSNPSGLTNVNGTIYFTANDGTNGAELWKSDGNSAGTVLVRDINVGSSGSAPSDLTNFNGTLLFRATDISNGSELWKSDGSNSGTQIVKDILSGTSSSSPSRFMVLEQNLYFTATDGTNGIELWKTDGFASGTSLIKDIYTGPLGSNPSNLVTFNGKIYFSARDATNGNELWESDGTLNGTRFVADLNLGNFDSNPNNFKVAAQRLFFTATENVNGTELWFFWPEENPKITSSEKTSFEMGQSSSFKVTANGYPAPTFTVSSGTLPSGVTFTNSGLLSGIPSAGTVGIYPITIKASNGIGTDATQSFTLTITQAPSFTSADKATFTTGTAGSFTVVATGFPAPTFSLSSGTLPSGVTLSAGGLLSGTPADGTGGTYPVTIKATNGVGTDATQSFTLTVNQAPAITSADKVTFTTGAAGSFTVVATGFPAPTFSLASGTLPAGVTLSATGSLAGTPEGGTGGIWPITIKATNGVGTDATQSFTLTVNQAPAITSANKATFTTGAAGSFTVVATGFPAPTFSLSSGTLPSGVTLSVGGLLSGTPADGTGGTYTITIKATNGVGTDATQPFTLTVNQAPAITSANKATFTTGAAGSFTVVATGFPAPTFSLASGTLPAGVTLSATGSLAGTPEAGTGGIWPITIKATNGVGTDVSQSFTLTVNQAPAITSSGKASFVVAQAGSFQMTASGYPTPTFSKTSGVLPDGVTLSASGTLSGKPIAGSAGTYQFEVKASNGTAPDAKQVFTLTVNLEGTINFTSQNRASFVVGDSGTFQVRADGLPDPTYSLDSGTLPSGINLSATGVLSGTPSAGTSGIHSFVIKATNGVNADATQAFTLTVNQVPAFTSLDETTFVAGESGTFTAKATGFPAPVFSLVSGSLPSGVSLSSSGVLSGTPAAGTGGSYLFTLKASNGVGSGVTQAFTLTVNQAPAITSDNKATFITGATGSFTAVATGYPVPVFSVVAGNLPSGITLSSGGLLSGTSADGTGGIYNITVKAANGVGTDATQLFTLTVNQSPAFTSANATTFRSGQTGSFNVLASGFPKPSFSILSGSLPSGVTMGADGNIQGTPDAGTGGVYSIRVGASNGVAPETSQTFTLTVEENPVIFGTDSRSFRAGLNSSYRFTSFGYPAPAFAVQGTLPAGVALSADGLLSGIPPTAAQGVYPITILATNGLAPDARKDFILTVTNAPTITSTDAVVFRVGEGKSFQMAATGTPAPGFIHSGNLPQGVTFSNTGLLSGTPAAGTSGTYPLFVTASNGVNPDDTQGFTLVVQDAPVINSPPSTTFTVGQASGFQMTAAGYPVPVYTVISGTLPAGISLTAGGLLSGTPAASTGGTYRFKVQASNGVGTDATQAFTLTVNQAPSFTSNISATFTTGTAGSFQASASGYPSPVFALASGTLPSGVTLSTAGLLSGTPAAQSGGSYPITLKASNGTSFDATQAFLLTVNQQPMITSVDSTTFNVGQAGIYTIAATGFPAPVFSITTGSLPDGVTLASGGALSGTPANGTGGTYRFTVQAANGIGTNATQAFSLTVNQGLAITSLNTTTFSVGQSGSFLVTATGNPGPVFSIASGLVPAGLIFNTNGTLSGTPLANTGGSYPLVIRASNSIGNEVTQSFTLTINQTPVITSGNKASFQVGKSGSYSLAATGYPAPAFSVNSGSLPAGVGLTADGKLQGVALPGSKGSYSFTVKASNAGGSTLQNYTVAVSQEGVFAVAARGGGRDFSKLAIYSNGTGNLLREIIPFPGFKGEFYVSSGDITGDGIEDIAVGSGQGSQNGHVVVFDGALLLNPNLGKAVELPYKQGGSVRASLYAFVGYSSGVAVRLADMNDDGFDDMVLAPGTGAGTRTPAHLRIWNGKDCMADFEAGKPLPYDYRWEMASFWAFGEGSNPGGGLALSVIRQAGPDLIIASQLFKDGSKVFRYDGQKVLTTVADLTGWQEISMTGNTVVAFDREGNRFFANGGTDSAATDNIFVRDKDKKAAYTIDRIFGNTPGGLRLGLANVDFDAEDELLVTRGTDSTTKIYDLLADKAILIETLKPGGNSGWV